MTYLRNILDLRVFSPYIDNVVLAAETVANGFGLEPTHLFKKNSYNHPVAEIPKSHDGSFEAFPNKLIRKCSPVLESFKELESTMGISDLILTRYITRFQAGDFLNWRKNRKSIAKFLSIATTPTHLSFKDETIVFSPYYGIIFNQQDVHSISDVKTMENWIVFMIPEHVDPLKNYEIYC